MLEVQSKLEAIAFNTSMECNYARNPFTNQHLMPSTSEDVIRQMPVDKRPFSTGADGGVSSLRQLPHGRGNLETVRGETIYSGNWCEGTTKQFCSLNHLPFQTFNFLCGETSNSVNFLADCVVSCRQETWKG